jgi:hypothetical protein
MGHSHVRLFSQNFTVSSFPPSLSSPSEFSFSSATTPATEPSLDPRGPPEFAMTSYENRTALDMPAERSSESHKGRLGSLSSGGSRQKLPPLSSLFGPSTSSHPLNSPVSDRHGTYSATSPLDRPRLLSADRGQQASYFPLTVSPSAPPPRSSYDPDRRSQHGGHAYSGPRSPRYPEARPHSRPDIDSRWTTQQDAGRTEYAPSTREPLESPRTQFQGLIQGSREPSSAFSDYRGRVERPKAPPTPTNTTFSDGLSSKDGLGPKIWTGTHFLPRFVRAAEVPGEGMCYFYDDGTHCKTVIDGEAVNAHWGVTKAGKPRKRLAIACVTCREKKIKCDPDFPRCVQCEKFGRVCRFKNA